MTFSSNPIISEN